MTKNLTFDIAPDELEIFLEDVNDCLKAMERGILHLEQRHDPETLNSIFRAAHTLKALGGAVGHRQMAELTHTLETLFEAMRDARLTTSQAVADELLAAVDILKTLRDEIVDRQSRGVDIAPLLARLDKLQDGDEDQAKTPAGLPPALPQLTPEQTAQLEEMRAAGQTILEIEIIAAAESFASTARLYQAATALLETGQIVAQQPALDDLTEGDDRLGLILATEAEPGEIETILGDIEELAEFHVQLYAPEQTGRPDTRPASPPSSSEEGTVRISIERLDTLMNLVGELVTNRTRLLQIEEMLRVHYGKDGAVGALSEMAPHFSYVINQLQEEVMRARMLPIASLFNKFPRLVRDTARAAAKQVNLVIEGETTELDRAIIEAISDPLIHLLRNAVDHGLETPEARQAAGKPPTGTVRLTAAPVEGQIIITVADDGRGIDPVQIRRSATRNGGFTEEEIAKLTDDEIFELIFLPSISTAIAVTEMSGRGVGLDVVRTNIERLSGSVEVITEVGQGTTFQLTLPLTLALVQTMLVTVRNTLYAIPITSINGALHLAEASLSTVKGRPALTWHEATVPLLDLREFFVHPHLTTESADGGKPKVVLVSWGKHRVGLIVDKIIGQQEIVVKSLSPIIGHPAGLLGATILGDGRVALIVDIPSLINAALQARRQKAI